ncbi:SAM hydrolase/SAM-dependent halogenase family protein [Tengunoibacter tsumagoiensis]|uniref:Adenosyl-chloride synthase n=1 Tax=Tengunoibacter tsumagoiensis TaxID=2014871 RepID=A0A402A485_9CHLR|nr:SAM-dependent chlorinase/fluorinase [Tengunoibacter tsumagoiensis]GCE13922.1 hypothetical protein KTT_37810 [Tengunoibacter tsumagoiensis]
MHQNSSLCSPSGVIALLTDFGVTDPYVGVMKGVVLRLAPQVQCLDLTHGVAPQQIRQGAWLLETSYRYFAPGTIFTCVVDPGVGSQRHPIAFAAGEWYFVGPDNGMFSAILRDQPVHAVVALSNPDYCLPQISATFQGRDIFAPISAHLANGVPLAEFGPSLQASDLQRLPLEPGQYDGRIEGQIVHCDHFGNLITDIPADLVPNLMARTPDASMQLVLPVQGIAVAERRSYFAERDASPHPFYYLDSSGYIGIAVQNGNAASQLGVQMGDSVFVLCQA